VPGIWTQTQTQAWQRVNRRIDRYGGSAENRCRFLFEVVAALVAQVEAGRLGVRCRWRLRPQDFAPHSFQLKRGRCGGGTRAAPPAPQIGAPRVVHSPGVWTQN
jgi:NADH:flavin oxidoreductase/NADH oxidase family protein